MKAFAYVRRFRQDQSGAVTVDWVVLTAAVVGLGLAVLAVIRGGTAALTSRINSQLSAVSIDTTGL